MMKKHQLISKPVILTEVTWEHFLEAVEKKLAMKVKKITTHHGTQIKDDVSLHLLPNDSILTVS